LRSNVRGFAANGSAAAVAVVACHRKSRPWSASWAEMPSRRAPAEPRPTSRRHEIDSQRCSVERHSAAHQEPVCECARGRSMANSIPDGRCRATLTLRITLPDSARHQEIPGAPSRIWRSVGRGARRRMALMPCDRGSRVLPGQAQGSPQTPSPTSEAAIQQLNDLGIVVEEWPVR